MHSIWVMYLFIVFSFSMWLILYVFYVLAAKPVQWLGHVSSINIRKQKGTETSLWHVLLKEHIIK